MKPLLNLINKTTIISLVFLIIGITLGIGITNISNTTFTKQRPIDELRSGGYQYINPLYECSTNEFYGSKEFINLQNNLEDEINLSLSKGPTTHISVYFRDLNHGAWFGINEKENFSPASLLKIPIMITYFKEAENDPKILKKEIEYNLPLDQQLAKPVIKPVKPATIGNKYPIEELIEKMLIYSDNNSLGLLTENITRKKIDDVSLDLHIPRANTLNDFMNVKEYSTLFRVLFNSSYLNKYYSEKALKILTKSEFNEGLRKPIPQNIPIAHKFGERRINGSPITQLHDCGIVYYPDYPYLICVMTRGTDFKQLEKEIQNVSRIIYNEVKNKNN